MSLQNFWQAATSNLHSAAQWANDRIGELAETQTAHDLVEGCEAATPYVADATEFVYDNATTARTALLLGPYASEFGDWVGSTLHDVVEGGWPELCHAPGALHDLISDALHDDMSEDTYAASVDDSDWSSGGEGYDGGDSGGGGGDGDDGGF